MGGNFEIENGKTDREERIQPRSYGFIERKRPGFKLTQSAKARKTSLYRESDAEESVSGIHSRAQAKLSGVFGAKK
jgi:hypothetical protein